jgi:hypothetical protein
MSSNGGCLAVLWYMSCSLSSLRFSIVHMRVSSCVCSVVCDGFVGYWVSSYLLVGWISRSGLIGVVENVRLVDLHPSFVIVFTGGGGSSLDLAWLLRSSFICLQCGGSTFVVHDCGVELSGRPPM